MQRRNVVCGKHKGSAHATGHARCGRGATYTRRRLPVTLVYAAEFENVADAFAMEKRVQGWSHAKRQALIDGDWEEIKRLSKKPRNR